MGIGSAFAILILLLCLCAITSLVQHAFVQMRPALLEKEAEEGSERARRLIENAPQEQAVITVFSLIRMLAVAAIFIGATETFHPALALDLLKLLPSMGEVFAQALAGLIVFIVCGFVCLVFGELVPQRVAGYYANKLSQTFLGLTQVVLVVFSPLRLLADALSQLIARIFAVSPEYSDASLSEEEIKSMVDENEELADDEKRMIQDIIEMGDTLAREVMTPRADMILVEDTETVRQAIDRMRGTGYSRLPIFHEDRDDIIGIVRFKDLIVPLMDQKGDELAVRYANKALFIPETKPILPLLSEMQTDRQQMAIVIDEYGGTDGLITIEDIVEEVVGEIIDETDLEDDEVVQLGDREWLAQGSLSCYDAEELGFPIKPCDDYDTIAGWFLYMVSFVPQIGDTFDYEGFRFTIKSMRRRRIATMRIQKLTDEEIAQALPDQAEESAPNTLAHEN